MKSVLIIHNGPIGTLVDSMKWCETLKNHFNVSYLELDGPGRVPVVGIRLFTVPCKGSRAMRGLRFVLTAFIKTIFFHGPIIIVYFPGCWLLGLFCFWKRINLDIRTLSVNGDARVRSRENSSIRFACKFFSSVTIIQKDLISELCLPVDKFTVLPLGADVISKNNKNFDSIRLLYVGTFDGRRVGETIEGVKMFLDRHPSVLLSYDIVGDGRETTKEEVDRIIAQNGMANRIKTYGRVLNTALKPFFDRNNIGVSYVPITPWFDHQPPTKTFEYIMSGLFCLATKTDANAEIVSAENGLLHEDSALAFSGALENLLEQLSQLNSQTIRSSLNGCTWQEITDRTLVPLLESL